MVSVVDDEKKIHIKQFSIKGRYWHRSLKSQRVGLQEWLDQEPQGFHKVRVSLSPCSGFAHWLHPQTLCGGTMTAAAFSSPQVQLQRQRAPASVSVFVAPYLLLLAHVTIPEPIAVAELMSYPD